MSLLADLQRQWPPHIALFVTPFLTEFSLELRHRIAAICPYVALRRRPGPHIANHFSRGPFELHLECFDRNLGHWHRDVMIVAFDNVSFRRPVGFDLGKYFLENLVALGTYMASFIGPDGQYAAWPQYPACLVKESLHVEPVECLGDSNQVDRLRIDARRLGRRNPKFYLSMRIGRGDLLFASVRCHDLLEKRGKGACGLAIAGGAVPRELMLAAKCCQEGEQRFRIAGSMRGIAAGVTGKMILETVIDYLLLLTSAVRLAPCRLCLVIQRQCFGVLVDQRLDARVAGRMR